MAACRVEDDNREVVGYMERNSERAQANARLIAAAPMLLAALERAECVIEVLKSYLPDDVSAVVAVWAAEVRIQTRAAIRAAKGESNG